MCGLVCGVYTSVTIERSMYMYNYVKSSWIGVICPYVPSREYQGSKGIAVCVKISVGVIELDILLSTTWGCVWMMFPI